MSRKRIYVKTSGYFVYAHTTPNGMIYVGMSKLQPCQRWHPKQYKDNSLAPYIKQYGWENIEHRVLIDGLTKKEAEQWEDKLIMVLSINGLCINERRSGGIKRDDKQAYYKQYNEDHKEERKQWREDHRDDKQAYNKQYNEDHKDYIKAYNKQRLSTHEGKIYNRVSNYNRNHTPIETPMEAKRKYLECGYIPTYIKHDDLV